jgi:two-component system, NtrC family, response regulator AtoC
MARVVAATDSVVLLLGESGSGKDHMAKFIHESSKRSGGPFFSINCAAVPPELAESELFGHERGAFTGAQSRKRGLLELAEGGTLLLNEIGELSLHLQAKLLTFLDTRQFTRVGGEQSISINARLIAATNRELETEVAAARFRQDLFYRINVMSILVPPLRKRREDIPILTEEILSQLVTEMQLTRIPPINGSVMRELTRYDWPGNVRELRNVLERALMLWDGGSFDVAVPLGSGGIEESSFRVNASPERPLGAVVDEVTKIMCAGALQRCNGNKKAAACVLKVSRDSFYRYLKKFDIEYEGSE